MMLRFLLLVAFTLNSSMIAQAASVSQSDMDLAKHITSAEYLAAACSGLELTSEGVLFSAYIWKRYYETGKERSPLAEALLNQRAEVLRAVQEHGIALCQTAVSLFGPAGSRKRGLVVNVSRATLERRQANKASKLKDGYDRYFATQVYTEVVVAAERCRGMILNPIFIRRALDDLNITFADLSIGGRFGEAVRENLESRREAFNEIPESFCRLAIQGFGAQQGDKAFLLPEPRKLAPILLPHEGASPQQ